MCNAIEKSHITEKSYAIEKNQAAENSRATKNQPHNGESAENSSSATQYIMHLITIIEIVLTLNIKKLLTNVKRGVIYRFTINIKY